MTYYIETTNLESDVLMSMIVWCVSNLKNKEDWEYIDNWYEELNCSRSFIVIHNEDDYIMLKLKYGIH